MLNVFAAVAAEVTHFLSVDINDVARTPACGAFPDEIGMRRLSCLYSLIDASIFSAENSSGTPLCPSAALVRKDSPPVA